MDASHVDVKRVCRRLTELGRGELAGILESHWNTRLKDYAQTLWSPAKSQPEMETELLEAFNEEFLRIGASDAETAGWTASLKRSRVLQTATHLTASEGPTFLAVHQLALMGVTTDEVYLIGAYTGVPYANAAWSGCLNLSTRLPLEEIVSEQAPGHRDLLKADRDRRRDTRERRISLIPGKLRDSRVYRSEISEKQETLLPHLCEALRRLTPPAREGDSFSAWAARFCRNQASGLFPGRKVIYFDFNEVIRSYLLRILPNHSHPLTKMLLEQENRNRVLSAFGNDIPLFSINTTNSTRIRIESLSYFEGQLSGPTFSCPLDEETLILLLENGTLCPGLFLGFTILSFLNGLTCLGSFEQVEYLSRYQQTWCSLKMPGLEDPQKVNTRALSCGRMLDADGNPVYPLDLLLGRQPQLPPYQTLGEWVMPLFPRLGVKWN